MMANTATAKGRPRLLGIRAAAAYLGISRATMSAAINEGQVQSVQIGQRKKVSTAALDKLLQQALEGLDRDND